MKIDKPVYYTPQDKIMFEGSVSILGICEEGGQVAGSGFIIDDHHVITAGHLAEACDAEGDFVVIVRDGKDSHMYLGVIVEVSKTDALKLYVEEKLPKAVAITRDPVLVGQELCAISGYSAWLKKCGYASIVEGDVILVGIPVVPGNSGSPLFNNKGEVVGIIVAGNWNPSKEKFGLAVPVSEWKDLLD